MFLAYNVVYVMRDSLRHSVCRYTLYYDWNFVLYYGMKHVEAQNSSKYINYQDLIGKIDHRGLQYLKYKLHGN